MSKIQTESKIGVSDVNLATGNTGAAETFTRRTSTGGTFTEDKIDATHLKFRKNITGGPFSVEDLVDGGADVPIAVKTLEDVVTKAPWVDARYYGTDGTRAAIDAAQTAIGANNKTLYLAPGGWVGVGAADANLTIAANVNLKPDKAYLTIANGKTLTINGTIEAGPWQIFSCTGTGAVAFGNGPREILAEWFGAVADNSTDNYAALQKAIDCLPTGGTLKLGKGTYKLTTNILTAKDDMTLVGAGMYESKIYAKDVSTSSTIIINEKSRVTIKDLTIDNDDLELPYNPLTVSANSCMEILDDSADILIERVRFLNSHRYGVYTGDSVLGNGKYPRRVKFKDCISDGASETGFAGTTGENITYEGCFATNWGYVGMGHEPGQVAATDVFRHIRYINNTVEWAPSGVPLVFACMKARNQSTDGTTVYSHGIEFIGNTIYCASTFNAACQGINIKGAGNSVIMGNTIRNMGISISVENSPRSVVQGNPIDSVNTAYSANSASSGSIYLSGSPYTKVADNNIYNASFCGIMVYNGCKFSNLTGNVITNPAYNSSSLADNTQTCGIYATATTNDGLTISGNTCTDNRQTKLMRYGIFNAGSRFANINGNFIQGAKPDLSETGLLNYAWLPGNYVNNYPLTTHYHPAAEGKPALYGSFFKGSLILREAPVAHSESGWKTITSGTLGTLVGVTGGISNGQTTLTVNSATDLRLDDWITIAGVTGPQRIMWISGTTVEVYPAADATVVGAAVAYSAPILRALGSHSGTAAQRAAMGLTANDAGFVIKDDTDGKFYGWDGAAWDLLN